MSGKGEWGETDSASVGVLFLQALRQAPVAPILARQIPSTLVADNFMSPMASPEATSLVPKIEA